MTAIRRKGGNIARAWSDGELRRMQKLVTTTNLTRAQIGLRFDCSDAMVTKLMQRHGWQRPEPWFRDATKGTHKGPRDQRMTRAAVAASCKRAREAKHREAVETMAQRMADAGCRVLGGAEFDYWRGIYEARDRAERARQERWA